jgi:hypothetical protein
VTAGGDAWRLPFERLLLEGDMSRGRQSAQDDDARKPKVEGSTISSESAVDPYWVSALGGGETRSLRDWGVKRSWGSWGDVLDTLRKSRDGLFRC